jgi:hypothetical protein
MKKAKGKNLGRGITILREFIDSVYESQEDLAGHYAPSECYRDVAIWHRKQFRLIKRRIKATTGLKYKIFAKEVIRRTSARWVWMNLPLSV